MVDLVVVERLPVLMATEEVVDLPLDEAKMVTVGTVDLEALGIIQQVVPPVVLLAIVTQILVLIMDRVVLVLRQMVVLVVVKIMVVVAAALSAEPQAMAVRDM
jgi:hypothetical protein